MAKYRSEASPIRRSSVQRFALFLAFLTRMTDFSHELVEAGFICRFIVVGSFRELSSTTFSAVPAMAVELDKSVSPQRN